MIDRAETLYRNLPGLVSKAFLYDPETREYGGNYVWETRRDLEAFLSSELFKAATEKFGQPKTLQIHPVAVYLDRGRLHVPVPETIESIVE
jgi:heme-degrading monooxygenase HmoA